uniref:Uncharacterized protein n=1 Tax=Tanacetum cinerariifolium TaxID=118510 RepID=A0A6L2M6W7_TANCI|nr:hypothetical protein [Tanacetum cinerariifolium]
MVKPELVKKLSKKDQLILDEELAFKLQAKEEEEEEERLAKEKAQQIDEFNIAWDDVRAKINSIPIYILVEKMYPLTNHTLHQMFNDVKLQVDYECEMPFELLRLVKKHLKERYVLKIKRLLDNLEVTAIKVCVTLAKQNLVLFRVIDGVVQLVAPTTIEQWLAWKNELR